MPSNDFYAPFGGENRPGFEGCTTRKSLYIVKNLNAVMAPGKIDPG